jgi:hypothetical protein
MAGGGPQGSARVTEYAIGLAILLLNDFIFKSAFPGFVTGKLSDFAGLFVFAVFVARLCPSHTRAACVASGIFFVAWKSPLSEPLIREWNAFGPYAIDRVVDWSDLVALAVLPFAWLIAKRAPRRWRWQPVLAVASLFAFAATSRDPNSFRVPWYDDLHQIQTPSDVKQSIAALQQCGMRLEWADEFIAAPVSPLIARFGMHYTITSINPPRDIYANVTAERREGMTFLDVNRISAAGVHFAGGPPSPEVQRAVRRDLATRLERCLHK